MRRKNKLLLPALASALGLLAFPVSHAMAASSAAADSSAVTDATADSSVTTAAATLASFHHVVADPSAGFVFLSGSSGIVVTDSSGNAVTTLDPGNSVAGLALSGNDSTLYAALTTGDANSDSIDAISVPASGSSFTENYTALPSGDVPASLALQSGTLWVSYTDSSNAGGIGSLVPGSGTFTPAASGNTSGNTSGNAGDTWSAAPDLAADPSDTGNGTLVAVAGDAATVYAITGGTLAAGAKSGSFDCANETQLAVAPGGGDFFAACGSAVSEYATKDLSAQVASYAAGSSVAAGADGDVAVGTSSGINVYGAGSGTAAGSLLNVINQESVAPGGLAWDNVASGQQLVAVTGSGGSYTEQIVDSPEQAQPSLTLAVSGTPVAGHVALNGTFKLSYGEVPAGATVAITRASGSGASTGTSTQVGNTASIGTDGSFTVTDTNVAAGTYTYTATVSLPAGSSATAPAPVPVTVNVAGNSSALKISGPAQADIIKPMRFTGAVTLKGGDVPVGSPITITRKFGKQAAKFTVHTTTTAGGYTFSQSVTGLGTYTYTAAYAGDPALRIPAAAATHKVVTTKIKAPLTVTGPTTYTYEPKIWVTAHLGSTYTNRTVSIYGQTAGSKTRKLIKRGRVNSHGSLIIADTTPYTTKFTAVFSGDGHYAARGVTRTVTVLARVSMSMTGYYGSKKVSGTTYRLYHHNAQLVVNVTVRPNKYGQCAWVQTQEYYKGTWHTNENTPCRLLSASSQLYGYLAVTKADHGYEYRVRAHFLPSSKNPGDAGNVSGWPYVMI